jgi:hypothetical protein
MKEGGLYVYVKNWSDSMVLHAQCYILSYVVGHLYPGDVFIVLQHVCSAEFLNEWARVLTSMGPVWIGTLNFDRDVEIKALT